MSILSTNTKLIKVGQDYSAGSGISIDDKVISVTGGLGNTYSAGENISIYNQGEQLYISSKDWTNDIANASANAYNEAVAQIPAPFDPSFISGQVDNKLDTTAFTAWQNGQYTTDLQTIEGQISNKLDESAFRQVSGSFLTAINIPESATWNEVSQAYEQYSGTYLTSHQSLDGYAKEQWVEDKGYLTGVSIPESATWNEVSQAYEQASATYLTGISIPESSVWQDVSTTVQTNSAQWAEGGSGDDEVNALVHSNSGNWNSVTGKQDSLIFGNAPTASGSVSSINGSAIIDDYTYHMLKVTRVATANLYRAITSNSGNWNTVTNKLDTSSFSTISGNFYPADNPSGFITGVDLSNYYTKNETSGKEELANAFANIPSGDVEVNSFVHNNSATINEVNTTYQSNSSNYITAHQSLDGYATTSWVNEQGYLTEVSIPESATWNEVSTTVQTNSAQWSEGGGGAISSYTTEWCHYVPPYGDNVINRLNDKYLKAFISDSADRADFANNANNANSANYAETVNETYVENKGFIRNLSSEYGTISVIHNNIIESTNSAISRVGNEGFVSSFDGASIGPEGNGTVTFSWDKSLPNTTINLDMSYSNNEILTYSANTNLTGEIVLPTGVNTQTINIPNATEFKVWSNIWIGLNGAVVSAADRFETVVGELAWASALPTYEYDTTNKISAINGSALAGGSALPISAGPGIKANLVDNTLVFSNDETVLFYTTAVYGAGVCNLSESLKNFERIAVLPTRGYNGTPNPGGAGPWNYFDTDQIVGDTTEPFQAVCPCIMEYINWKISQYNPNSDCTVLTWYKGFQKNMQNNAFYTADSFTDCVGIQKVIGINRK